ncbi:MAG: hypothetical protein D6743_01615 [Calditrichaeota bacterium]|nr:MAG: hypothetical protein D6743_01615 [Calditrichota bacterium]
MDIKEKLRLIDTLRQRGASPAPQPSEPVLPTDHTGMGARRVENKYGAFLYLEKDFPGTHCHGRTMLGSFPERALQLLSLVAKESGLRSPEAGKILFIDTETTGLSGGSGTCAFLVGIGYFQGKTFRVAQYFMDDFNQEAPLLAELNDVAQHFELLVSYNGKSFDIPLLNTRNVLHRMKSPFSRIRHLDLLHTVRRLWGHRLSECSLTTVECEIAGFKRGDDVPGFLVPSIYFRYLRDRDDRFLSPVLRHNRLDIVSLVAIVTRALQQFESPQDECTSPEDVVALAKCYETMQRYDEAVSLYEKFLDGPASMEIKNRLALRAAFGYKKLREWERAAQLWQDYISSAPYHPLPFIELAKHYEHRRKDYRGALELVDKALAEISILESLNGKVSWLEPYKADLTHRRQRLQNRLRSAKSGT